MELTEQNQIRHIEELLERFFDGSTSNEEERELTMFFSGDTVPEQLVSYNSLFAYFKTDLEQDLLRIDSEATESYIIESIPEISSRQRFSGKGGFLRQLLTGSAAALFLCFICITAYNIIDRNNDVDPFEGSFIIRNGVKITDLNQIRPELELTLNRVLYKEQQAEIEFLQMEYEVSAKYIDFIRSFPEGPIRDEVIMSFQ